MNNHINYYFKYKLTNLVSLKIYRHNYLVRQLSAETKYLYIYIYIYIYLYIDIFKNSGFKIDIVTNLKIIDFLEFVFDLNNIKYYP